MKIVAIVLALAASAFAQQCGDNPISPNERGLDGRIVNGVEAVANSWPWQVAMCNGANLRCTLICGGTLIKSDVILTAAHCVVGQSTIRIGWKFGAHSLSSTAQDGQGIARSGQFIRHPEYNSQIIINDIAVVKLTNVLEFGQKIQPICLASTDDHLQQGQQLIATGWGRLSGTGAIPDKLQQAGITYHNRQNCAQQFTGLGHNLDDTVMCGGGDESGTSVCFGDSGGPWIKKDSVNNKYYQYGINSFVFTRDCYGSGRPNGFARVAALCDFLRENTDDNDICLTPPEAQTRFHELPKAPLYFA